MSGLLFIKWNVNPEIFRIGGFALRWYSLLFVAGFVLGYYMFLKFLRREGVREKMLDPLLYTVLAATIIGARLGHCCFYDPGYYFGSWTGFWEIFQPWKGGLASHGGAIGILLALWWYSKRYGRKYDIDFAWILDHICITVAFAGFFIRMGNLFNSEIYGDPTNLPWGFIFERNGETLPKHPTQLYEALAYLILGLFMLALYKFRLPKLYKGSLFGIFLLGCFGFRFAIEFIKEPQVGFEQNMTLDMGQWLSVPFILIGIAVLIISFVKKVPAIAQTGKKN